MNNSSNSSIIIASACSKVTKRLQCIQNHCNGQQKISLLTNSNKKHFGKGSPFPPLSNGVLRFYNMQFCPFAERTKLILEYKNIPYETVNINLKNKPAWFWRRNPLGLVPVLEQGDMVICESTATCEWLDDTYPQRKLQPSDPLRKAADRELLEYYGQMTSRFVSLLRSFAMSSSDKDLHVSKIKRDFKHLENVLSKRKTPFYGGESPALIDFYLWPHLVRVPASVGNVEPSLLITQSSFPGLAAWLETMHSIPAVKSSTCSIDGYRHFLQTLMAGEPDYDYGLAPSTS